MDIRVFYVLEYLSICNILREFRGHLKEDKKIPSSKEILGQYCLYWLHLGKYCQHWQITLEYVYFATVVHYLTKNNFCKIEVNNQFRVLFRIKKNKLKQ